MKCPHCEEELPGSPCPKCGETVFEEANYCMDCGTPLKEGLEEISKDEDFFEYDDGSDFEDRELCPDGTCTGIIIDGKCTECGKTEEEAAAVEDQKEAPAVEPEKTVQQKKEEKGE